MDDSENSTSGEVEFVRCASPWAPIQAVGLVFFLVVGLFMLPAVIAGDLSGGLWMLIWMSVVGYSALKLVYKVETHQDGLHVDYMVVGRQVIPWADIRKVAVQGAISKVCNVRYGQRIDHVIAFPLGVTQHDMRAANRIVNAILSAANQARFDETGQRVQTNRRASRLFYSDRPAGIKIGHERLEVTLNDGRVISAPLIWYPRLKSASAEERENYVLERNGIYWPRLDVDVSVYDLIDGEPPYEL